MSRMKWTAISLLTAAVAAGLYLASTGNPMETSVASLDSGRAADHAIRPTSPGDRAKVAGFPAATTAVDPDEWFLRQPEATQGSVLLGLGPDFAGMGSLAAYFLDLERRIAAGDMTAAMPAADLMRTCGLLTKSSGSAPSAPRPSAPIASVCRTLPEREPGHEVELVAQAARMGVRDAVLREWGFVPTKVAYSRDPAVRKAWASGVAARLETLADKGDIDARISLGRTYLARDFGMLDYQQAARHYHQFLVSAPLTDPRREGAQAFLSRACSAGNLTDATLCG